MLGFFISYLFQLSLSHITFCYLIFPFLYNLNKNIHFLFNQIISDMSYDDLLHTVVQNKELIYERYVEESRLLSGISLKVRTSHYNTSFFILGFHGFFCSLFFICSLFHKGTLKLLMKLVYF